MVNRTLRTSLRTFFLLIVLAASICGYMWYQLQLSINSALSFLPAGYSLNYQYHYMDHEGHIYLKNVKLNQKDMGLILHADTATISFPSFKMMDWLNIHNLHKDIILNQYPDEGTLNLDGVIFFVSDIKEKVVSDSIFGKLFIQGCSDRQDLSIQDLEKINQGNIKGKFQLHYLYNAFSSQLKLSTKAYLDHFLSFEQESEWLDVQNSPYLVKGSLILYKPEFFVKRDSFCATEQNLTIEEFRQQHLQKLSQFCRERQLILSDSFIDNYYAFINNTNNLAFLFSPSVGIPFSDFKKVPLSNAIKTFGFSLNLNGQNIVPISISSEQETSSNLKKEAHTASQKKQVHFSKEYEKPSMALIETLKNKHVTITNAQDKVFKGKVTNISDKTFDLLIKHDDGDGEIIIQFNPDNILKIATLLNLNSG